MEDFNFLWSKEYLKYQPQMCSTRPYNFCMGNKTTYSTLGRPCKIFRSEKMSIITKIDGKSCSVFF